jgi:hypothetical protein
LGDLRLQGALFAVTLVLVVAAPVVVVGGGRGRGTIVVGCLLSAACLIGWAALMGIDLSRSNTGTIDCAVQPQNGERETFVIALMCAVVPVVVAVRSSHIRRLALAGIGVTASASVVVVSSFVYIIAANPAC